MSQEQPLPGEIVEERAVLTVGDLCRIFAVDERHIDELVEEGVISVDSNRHHRMALQRCGAAPGAHRAALGARPRHQSARRRARAGTAGRTGTAAARTAGRTLMSSARIGCLRILRRNRRSGLQEDLSRPLRHGASGHPADSRSSAWRAPAGISRSCASARAQSLEHAGDFEPECFAKALRAAALCRRRLCRPRDLSQAAQRAWSRRRGRSTISRFRRACSRASSRGSANPAARTTHVSSSRSPSAAIWRPRRRSTGRCTRFFRRSRFFASITISARKRCRICCTFVSPIRFSSRSGIGSTSRTCRSPWPNRSAWRGAAPSTKRSARSATWCRIICCR